MEQHEQFAQQSLTEHLKELRSCLLRALVGVGIGCLAAYSVIDPLADWFLRPLVKVLPAGKTLIFISYQEGFFFI